MRTTNHQEKEKLGTFAGGICVTNSTYLMSVFVRSNKGRVFKPCFWADWLSTVADLILKQPVLYRCANRDYKAVETLCDLAHGKNCPSPALELYGLWRLKSGILKLP